MLKSFITLDRGLQPSWASEKCIANVGICACLSYSKCISLSVEAGKTDMQSFLQISKDVHITVSALLYDGQRLIQEFFPAISVSALQVYFTALPFTPTGTELYNTYHKQMEGVVMVQGVLPKQWSACIR